MLQLRCVVLLTRQHNERILSMMYSKTGKEEKKKRKRKEKEIIEGKRL
jgi:hypothetical protein